MASTCREYDVILQKMTPKLQNFRDFQCISNVYSGTLVHGVSTQLFHISVPCQFKQRISIEHLVYGVSSNQYLISVPQFKQTINTEHPVYLL